jgi:uncharacterized membrane protein YfcA
MAGLLIGCVGIGGVIIVPALVYIGGLPFETAIAGAMMGYILAGLMGAAVYASNKSINWSMAGWLCAGAMPAAVAGAWLSNNVPTAALAVLIGLLTLGSGLQALLRSEPAADGGRAPGPAGLIGIGGLTGVLSALTGTGGPLVLVPTMLWLKTPVLTAIGLAQAVQPPLAILATIGNFMFGNPDVVIGLALGVGLAGGTYVGARLAHSLPRETLRKVVAGVLIVIGATILLRALAGV